MARDNLQRRLEMPTCPGCGSRIPLSRIFFTGPTKTFSCERCGISLRFNAARAANFGLIAGAIILLPLMGLLPFPFHIVRAVWLAVAVIALLLIYPVVAQVDKV